jgi:hypothetical protein
MSYRYEVSKFWRSHTPTRNEVLEIAARADAEIAALRGERKALLKQVAGLRYEVAQLCGYDCTEEMDAAIGKST